MSGRRIWTAMAVATALAPVAAVPASAQSNTPAADYEYCRRLSEIYLRYIGSDEVGPGRHDPGKSADLEGKVAVAKCQAGDTAAGIPVLEKKLRANGFSLPRR
jgi:hypothetical protein